MPTRATDGSKGHDVYLRAIVCRRGTMDAAFPFMRKSVFDFQHMPEDPLVAQRVLRINDDLAYRIGPGESVLCGMGFITEMEPATQYVLHPRSGLQSVRDIVLVNAHTIVDSDYRGEAGALLKNCSSRVFALTHGMRIAQVVFDSGLIPRIDIVGSYDALSSTTRGAKGFGSTGL